MSEENQKKVQEKLMLYQILQNQLEELTSQGSLLEQRVSELDSTENALREMKTADTDAEALIPMGAGCYAHGSVREKNKFIVEIGAGIMANKSLEEAVAIIEGRKKEIKDLASKLNREIENLNRMFTQTAMELQQLSAENQEKIKVD